MKTASRPHGYGTLEIERPVEDTVTDEEWALLAVDEHLMDLLVSERKAERIFMSPPGIFATDREFSMGSRDRWGFSMIAVRDYVESVIGRRVYVHSRYVLDERAWAAAQRVDKPAFVEEGPKKGRRATPRRA